jgi:hypothetical protein
MKTDDSQQAKVHHHDWLIKKIEDRISKLISGDVEPSIPIPPEKALEISHIVSPPRYRGIDQRTRSSFHLFPAQVSGDRCFPFRLCGRFWR